MKEDKKKVYLKCWGWPMVALEGNDNDNSQCVNKLSIGICTARINLENQKS